MKSGYSKAARNGRANGTANPEGLRQFILYLPVVETHASIQARRLSALEREEFVAEAVAAAFLIYDSALKRGTAKRVTPSTLANYAVLHVKNSRHAGGQKVASRDVLSKRAQGLYGFRVSCESDFHAYSRNSNLDLNSRELRLDDYADSRTPVPDQVAFRMDWSAFLNQNTARTRAAIGLLAAGYSRKEVSEYLGVTPAAITQRMARVEKDWIRYSA
jgi:hypothetical protein